LGNQETTDVVVVGAGPTGLACGIELKRRGVDAIMLDKGCVVNSIYHYPTNLVFFTTPELLEIGDIPMTSLNEKPVRAEALKYYRRVADHYRLDIRQYQLVDSISGDDGRFVTHSIDSHGCPHEYVSKKVILSTGYYDVPNKLNVPGEDLPKVIHYYKEPHPYYNHDVLVVGAKNSAAIAALELHWSGARVTMAFRGEGISPRVKYWIKPNIENRISNREITAFHRTRTVEIREDTVVLATPDGEKTIKNDFVFAMVGYRPDLDFLEKHGIKFDAETERPYTHPETL
jgi:thioredoxin reductase (NADPH)